MKRGPAATGEGRFARIDALLGSDPGRRGLAGIRHRNDVAAFARTLRAARRVMLVTGFVHAASGQAETDGPLGTVTLGRALARLGHEVLFVTDRTGGPLLHMLEARPLLVLALQPAGARTTAADRTLDEFPSDALVAIERPGRTPDGSYRNLRGGDISGATEPLDELFLAAARRRIPTLGIGDGGNEIGMGSLSEADRLALAKSLANASVVGVDHLLVAGVSNWGAYGVVAALSVLAGTPLLPGEDELRSDLERVLAGGAVDGITGRSEATVDGLPYADSVAMVTALAAAAGAK